MKELTCINEAGVAKHVIASSVERALLRLQDRFDTFFADETVDSKRVL
jgi:hypothetical protein